MNAKPSSIDHHGIASLNAHDGAEDPAPGDADAGIEQFHATFRDTAYYSTGREWSDYAPAYRYGSEAFAQHCDERFEQVESVLAENWEQAKPPSRLAWVEARGAVHDAWHHARAERPHVVGATDASD